MLSRLTLVLAVATVLLALSCEEGPHAGPAVTSAPTASPSAPRTVNVRGPVLVFASPPPEFGGTAEGSEPPRHWVRALDTYSGARWTILEYPVRAELAGRSFIAFDGRQVRRVAMDGSTEALLWEKWIHDLAVSKDGTKVAILPGDRLSSVAVLDAVTGDEVLFALRDGPPLDAMRKVREPRLVVLGEWSTGNDAFALDIDWQRLAPEIRDLWHMSRPIPPEQIAILTLDGGLREPPEYSLTSPDFRYALRPEFQFGMFSSEEPTFWSGFEVLQAQTGEVLWRIDAGDGARIIPYEVLTWRVLGHPEHVLWSSHPDGYVYFEYHSSSARPHAPDALAAWLAWVDGREPGHLTARVLDLETGESRPLPHAEWIGDAGERVDEVCGDVVPRSTCVLLLKGSAVFGSGTSFVALIELGEPLPLPAALFSEPCRWPGDC